jgi:hypothetical protein
VKDPDEYLERARAAEKEAEHASDPSMKACWREIAENFRDLAAMAARLRKKS